METLAPTHRAYLAYAALALAAYAAPFLAPAAGVGTGVGLPDDVALLLGAVAIVGGLVSVVVASALLVQGRASALAGGASLLALVLALRFLTPSHLGVAYGLAAWGPPLVAPAVLALAPRLRPCALAGAVGALALVGVAWQAGEAAPVPRSLDLAASLMRLTLAALLSWCAARTIAA